MTVSDHENNPFGVQWQRYWAGAPYPDLVKTIPHVAFEVDDLNAALEGQKVIIKPNSPSEGLTVAFIEVNGAPIELMQYRRLEMAEESKALVFHGGQSNYYVNDVEGMAAFYRDNFGFKETYRTPKEGEPEHVEIRLGEYLIGLSSVEAGRTTHHLPLDPGKPRGEIVLWTNDVDRAHAMLMEKRVLCIHEPHNFDVNEQLRLRVAWYYDPEGNIFQTVCQR